MSSPIDASINWVNETDYLNGLGVGHIVVDNTGYIYVSSSNYITESSNYYQPVCQLIPSTNSQYAYNGYLFYNIPLVSQYCLIRGITVDNQGYLYISLCEFETNSQGIIYKFNISSKQFEGSVSSQYYNATLSIGGNDNGNYFLSNHPYFSPWGIAYNSQNDYLYVADYYSALIWVFNFNYDFENSTGTLVIQSAFFSQSGCSALAIDQNTSPKQLYISVINNPSELYIVAVTIPNNGSNPTQYYFLNITNPEDIVIDSNHNLYCPNQSSTEIYKFNYAFKPNYPYSNPNSYLSTSPYYSTGIGITPSGNIIWGKKYDPLTIGNINSTLWISNSTIPCFNQDTKILTDKGYKLIQNLRKGDLVNTYLHGYRKIDNIGKGKFINNPSKWENCMYKMEKNDKNGLLEDLIITGGHSLLEDRVTSEEIKRLSDIGMSNYNDIIDDKVLVLASVSEKFVAIQTTDLYTFYHIVLESSNVEQRFGVWANGILTETISKKYFIKSGMQLL